MNLPPLPRRLPSPPQVPSWRNDNGIRTCCSSCYGRRNRWTCGSSGCAWLGHYGILGCGLFFYVYLVLGKLSFVSRHVYQPLITILASCLISNDTFQHDKATTPLFLMVVPLLIAGMIASLGPCGNHQYHQHHHPNRPPPRIRYNNCNMHHGTPNIPQRIHTLVIGMIPNRTDVILFLGIYTPLLVYTGGSIVQKIPLSDTAWETTNWNNVWSEIGNTFGIVALFGMSLILIPVTKYSYILQYFTSTQHVGIQQRIHQALGWCVMIGVLFHVAFHWYRWYSVQQLYHNVWSMMFIVPSFCWTTSDGTNEDTDSMVQILCPNTDTTTTTITSDCTCYGRLRNVMGSCAAIALLIVSLTTVMVPSFRRQYYRIFYIVHRVLGPIIFLFVILHWNRSIIYVSGNLLYYLAGTIPIWIVNRHRTVPSSNNTNSEGHIRITSVERIATCPGNDEKDVVALTFETTKEVIEEPYVHPGQYVQLHVPSISMVSHPFTINHVHRTTTHASACDDTDTPSPPHVAGGRYQLRILFRCVGPFTKQLARALLLPLQDPLTTTTTTTTGLPHIYVDGCYGPLHRSTQILHRHDHAVFVAGGIGITPYLSVLYNLLQISLHPSNAPYHDGDDDVMLNKITFYWICRDPKLIEYVQREYFDPIVALLHDHSCRSRSQDTRQMEVQIHVHQTEPHQGNHDHLPCHREKSRMRIPKNISYTNLEQEPNNKEDNASTNEMNTSNILLQNRGEGSGIPFVPSRFFPGPRITLYSRFIVCAIYSIIVWTGLPIIWYLYTRHQTKDTVLPRVLAPLLIALHAYLVSRGTYWLLMESSLSRLHWQYSRHRHHRKDSSHELVDDDIQHDTNSKATHPFDLRPSRTSDDDAPCIEKLNMSSSVEMGMVDRLEQSTSNGNEADSLRQTFTNKFDGPDVHLGARTGTMGLYIGRPTVHQILRNVETGCLRPAIYVCGPSSLMRDIRHAVNERCTRQCQRNPPVFIALYEETFEL